MWSSDAILCLWIDEVAEADAEEADVRVVGTTMDHSERAFYTYFVKALKISAWK